MIAVFIFSEHSQGFIANCGRDWIAVTIWILFIWLWSDKGLRPFADVIKACLRGCRRTLQGMIVFQVGAHWLVRLVTNICHLSLSCHKPAHLLQNQFWHLMYKAERLSAGTPVELKSWVARTATVKKKRIQIALFERISNLRSHRNTR